MTRPSLVLVGLAATAALAACGPAGSSGTAAPASTPAAAGTGAPARTVQFPGARGRIAEVDGTTLQVQSTTSQTAVTYTARTTLTKVVAGTLRDVTVGECVTVRSATAPGSATSTATTGPMTAATISLSQPVNGTCAFGIAGEAGAGFPGGLGDASGRTRTFTPGAGGLPSGRPTGPGAGFRQLGVTGKVLSVSGDAISVQPDGRRFAGGSTATPTPTEAPQVVDATAATTVTTTVPAKAADIAVGECATAIGAASDTGSIAATRISLEQPVNGQCPVAGFGGTGARP